MKLNRYILFFCIFFNFLQAKDFTTKSGNVIQGVTYFDESWIFSQTHNNKSITFSIFNNVLELKQTIDVEYPSHAQDLSILQKNGKTYLFTTGKHWNGVAMFELIKKEDKYKIVFKKNLKLGIGKNTPTISVNGKYIASVANKSVYIFDYKILNSKYQSIPLFSFVLDKIQRQKGQWKQGIAMKNNRIYVLSGDGNIDHTKYLIVYDAYGQVLDKIKLKLDTQKAKEEGNKLEVEGLAFKSTELYTTVMTGHNGKNKKQLLKIYEKDNK